MEEMDNVLIDNWNSKVSPEDHVWHLGDFAWRNPAKYINRLNGFLHLVRGSHDKQYGNNSTLFTEVCDLKRIVIDSVVIILCHYAMRVWQASHFNSWLLYGHSHGRLDPIGKSIDVGVDTHDFYPYSYEEIKEIMAKRPDNPNLVSRHKDVDLSKDIG